MFIYMIETERERERWALKEDLIYIDKTNKLKAAKKEKKFR